MCENTHLKILCQKLSPENWSHWPESNQNCHHRLPGIYHRLSESNWRSSRVPVFFNSLYNGSVNLDRPMTHWVDSPGHWCRQSFPCFSSVPGQIQAYLQLLLCRFYHTFIPFLTFIYCSPLASIHTNNFLQQLHSNIATTAATISAIPILNLPTPVNIHGHTTWSSLLFNLTHSITFPV